MLEIRDLCKNFAGLKAVDGVNMGVTEGSIVSLIGPNGAGKTTCFALITGFLQPTAGTVSFEGEDITGLAPHKIAERGMVRTFQIVQPFAGQTVRENIAVGAHLKIAARGKALERAEEIAGQVGLTPMLDQDAGDLTVAGRKRLEVARALATSPRIVLLDEVMAGLNPSEIRDIIPVIRGIRDSGITIFLIEHVMQAVMSLSDETFVLNLGRLIAHGSPAEMATDPQVIEAYLGHGAAQRIANQAAGEA